jgi:hypothetical protein
VEIAVKSEMLTTGHVGMSQNDTLRNILRLAKKWSRGAEQNLKLVNANLYAATEELCGSGRPEFERLCFGLAISASAGSMAENKFVGDEAFGIETISMVGNYSDYDRVQDLAACLRKTNVGMSRWLCRIEDSTRGFLDSPQYWLAICDVGKALHVELTLSGETVRSIFDAAGCKVISRN